MFRVIKNVGKAVNAYPLNADHPVIASLIARGLIRRLDNGHFAVFSQEATNGEICAPEDYIKIDSKGMPYPNSREFFLSNHKPIGPDTYEQIPKPLEAWDVHEAVSEEILFLQENKGLSMNENDKEAFFTAPLWGDIEKARKDAVIIFYQIDREPDGRITDISFNFVARNEFEKTYTRL